MADDKETPKTKRLPATYFLWSLPAYAAVVVLAYLSWNARMEKYMAPIREAEELRERLFYVNFEAEEFFRTPYAERIEILRDRLKAQVEDEFTSGSRTSIREGILVADTYCGVPWRDMRDLLGHAYSLGVTKAIFELGQRPPFYETFEMSLVMEDSREVLLEGLNALPVRIASKSLEIGEEPVGGIDVWYMDEYHNRNRMKKLLESSNASTVMLSVSDLVNTYRMSTLFHALKESGKDVALMLGEHVPDRRYLIIWDVNCDNNLPYRLLPGEFGNGDKWKEAVESVPRFGVRLHLMPGPGLLCKDIERFFSALLELETWWRVAFCWPVEPVSGDIGYYPRVVSICSPQTIDALEDKEALFVSVLQGDSGPKIEVAGTAFDFYAAGGLNYEGAVKALRNEQKMHPDLPVVVRVNPDVKAASVVDVLFILGSADYEEVHFAGFAPANWVPFKPPAHPHQTEESGK